LEYDVKFPSELKFRGVWKSKENVMSRRIWNIDEIVESRAWKYLKEF
jgi:hypothetical protein